MLTVNEEEFIMSCSVVWWRSRWATDLEVVDSSLGRYRKNIWFVINFPMKGGWGVILKLDGVLGYQGRGFRVRVQKKPHP